MLSELLDFFIQRSDFLSPLVIEHLQISIVAITIASVIGIPIGILISEKQKISSWMLGIVSFIYTIPSISLLGIFIPLTGIGNITAILALSIYALLPIIRSTYTGLTNVDKDVLEAAKSMGSTRLQIMYKVKFPLALPLILSGFRNMVVMTIALAGIASFIGAGGLGVAIYRGITTNNMTMTVAGSVAVALLALGADLIISLIERSYHRHSHHKITRKKKLFLIFTICISIIASTILWYRPQPSNAIHIATKPMTESLILGEILKQLIEDKTNLQVELTKGVGGGSSNIHPAMIKGDYIYSEYTGTAWRFILKKETLPKQEELYNQLVSDYEQNYNLTWLGLYGFNNSYGIAITKEFAQEHKITTFSDLANSSKQLVFGAEYDFYERDDGYAAMCEAYGFSFHNTVDLEIGLKYTALKENKVNAIIVYQTDGELNDDSFVLLQDNKDFFIKYYAGSVIRMDTLQKYTELYEILLLLDQNITDQEMSKMNSAVNNDNKKEEDVAHNFLIEKHLVEADNE